MAKFPKNPSNNLMNIDDPMSLMMADLKFVEEVFDKENISDAQIDVAEVRLRRALAEELVRAFGQEKVRSGLTYKKLADRLNKDPGLISRRFKGEENLTIRSIVAMFLAMGREIHAHSSPINDKAIDAVWLVDQLEQFSPKATKDMRVVYYWKETDAVEIANKSVEVLGIPFAPPDYKGEGARDARGYSGKVAQRVRKFYDECAEYLR